MEAVLDETDSCELNTESPDLKDLLNTLRYSRHLLLQMARAIAYTLDALDGKAFWPFSQRNPVVPAYIKSISTNKTNRIQKIYRVRDLQRIYVK